MRAPTLLGHERPLCISYDLVMLDLDGVVYVGSHAVPRAQECLADAARRGMRLGFITNNAARTPVQVAAHLRDLGVDAGPADVVTSAQAAATLIADKFGSGATVACLGGPGLDEALHDAGLEVVGPGERAEVLATGYGPEVVWKDIMRAAVSVRDGRPWVASNTDGTIPTAFGTAPGHGALVDLISRFAGVEPVVAGKPQRPLLDETMRRIGGARPLMVGDRLDTDIEGGRNAGVDTLLVLTGVTDLGGLLEARPHERPTYLARDLRGLLEPHAAPTALGAAWRVGGWTAEIVDGVLRVDGDGDGDDWWRAVAVAGWAYADATGATVDTDRVRIPEVAQVAR